MLTKELRSLQHPITKHFVKLRKDKKYRYEKKSAIVTGEKVVLELIKTHPINTLLIKKNYKPSKKLKAKKTLIVSDAILKKITGLEEPPSVAAEFALPKLKNNFKNKKYILVLDRISDPGNLGTLIRTALGLKWDGVILTPQSVDPFNEKSLRAARGACFHLPLTYKKPKEILSFAKENQIEIFVADMKGKKIDDVNFHPPMILVLSHESEGARDWENFPRVKVPMSSKIESLNVAISGSILMYFMRENI